MAPADPQLGKCYISSKDATRVPAARSHQLVGGGGTLGVGFSDRP